MTDDAPDNISRFDDLAARIFADCYKSFPSPARFDIYAISNTTRPASGPTKEPEAIFVRDTIKWLVEAGFLRNAGQNRQDEYFNLVLSAKAFEILKGAPSALSSTKTLGEAVLDSVQDAAKETGKEARKTAVSEIFKWGIRWMITP